MQCPPWYRFGDSQIELAGECSHCAARVVNENQKSEPVSRCEMIGEDQDGSIKVKCAANWRMCSAGCNYFVRAAY
jgi:hypothetical protein